MSLELSFIIITWTECIHFGANFDNFKNLCFIKFNYIFESPQQITKIRLMVLRISYSAYAHSKSCHIPVRSFGFCVRYEGRNKFESKRWSRNEMKRKIWIKTRNISFNFLWDSLLGEQNYIRSGQQYNLLFKASNRIWCAFTYIQWEFSINNFITQLSRAGTGFFVFRLNLMIAFCIINKHLNWHTYASHLLLHSLAFCKEMRITLFHKHAYTLIRSHTCTATNKSLFILTYAITIRYLKST